MTSPNTEADLIDLHVGSPVLPRSLPPTQINEDLSDNLLDSELPILEKKLQTATSSADNSSRKNSVDIEDILISIDDDNDDDDTVDLIRLRSVKRSKSETVLNICDNNDNFDLEKSLSCDNLEALNILKSLDDVLNASLLESDRILNKDEEEHTQECLEACLLDLDNYLQGYESSNDETTTESLQHTNEQRSSENSSQHDSNFKDGPFETIEDNLRQKLRHIEENYTKFLASGCVNRGFIEDNGEIHKTESEINLRCKEALTRTNPYRATIAAVRRAPPKVVPHLNRNNPRWIDRKSAPAADSDEDIDWSWVQDIARDETLARRAHATRDCCTGTVLVEPSRPEPTISIIQQEQMITPSPPSPTTPPPPPALVMVEQFKTNWLRNSMRRLQPLRIPSNEQSTSIVERPTSAPSRLLPTIFVPSSSPSTLTPTITTTTTLRTSGSQRSRPRSRQSRPSVVIHEAGDRARSSSASSRSRRPRSLDSSVTSIPSTVETSPSCTPAPTPIHINGHQEQNHRRTCENTNRHHQQNDMPEAESPLGQWPHSLSSMMACLGCTLGLFNISRFAILTIHFGANFIFQFFLLSLVFGMPLFTLQLCLGQQLGAGVIDMWRISPLFQGVGISLLLTQALIGLYSIIGVSWMFVFFRDSFITKMERYRWAEPFLYYRDDVTPVNGSYKLSETIPDYFSGLVLQRHHLASGNAYGTIKFQLAFNLAVVWMIVFVSLSKGLRSYGKVIYIFTILPIFGTFILCAKLLGMMPQDYVNVIFPETNWGEFFINSKCWLAAAQETFLTWGLLGTAVMQIASHNKNKHLLQRDSSLVVVITLTILLLVAFLANTCVQILHSYGYNYLPSSFERMSTYTFLRPVKDPLPPSLASLPIRYMPHNSFIIGQSVQRPGVDPTKESGYQVLQFATELIPATFAVLGSEQVSPFWSVLFYFIIILFGIAQQLAIWHCVITGIMAIKAKILKSWETTITLFSCVFGFLLGLPMATELGIYVVYFLDYTVGGMWWLLLVILLQIMAVFVVRGRPYSGDTVVTALFTPNNHPCLLSWAPALLSFTWNVILPVALMVLCITTFKNGNFKDIFIWHQVHSSKYWSTWVRQAGSLLQLIPILLIPIVAVIQSYRYLNNGPSDILDRIQLLYRPPLGEHMTDLSIHEAATASLSTTPATTISPHIEDPPPKYTPPPSYTTATGARIAKFLRQSIRRSVRRIANVLGESSNSRQRPVLNQLQPPPPDYNTVLVEMNQTTLGEISTIDGGNNSPIRISTLERLRNVQATPGSPTLTAAQVASILRSSFRRSTVRRGSNLPNNNNNNNNCDTPASLSAENLVNSVAPIGETSLVLDRLNSVEIKCEIDNSSSVI